jgi:hypothetical protein
MLIIYSDIAYTVFFVIWFYIFKTLANRKIEINKLEVVTTGRYSAEILNLPIIGTDEEELKKYFEGLHYNIVEVNFGRKFGGILQAYVGLDVINKKLRIEEVRA